MRKVKRAVQADPLLAPEFLKIVSKGLSAYKAAQEATRDQRASWAIRTLMLAKPKSISPAFLIDAIYIQFPKGPDSHSNCEMKFWDHFLKNAHLIDLRWVEETRGKEYIDWWNQYILPHIGENHEREEACQD